MPATATGRGAQVVLDPIGDNAKAARGAYAATLELNLAKQRTDVAAGTLADGSTSDGRTSTGGLAVDMAALALLPNAANDAAAATAGVKIGGLYRNANAVMQRIA